LKQQEKPVLFKKSVVVAKSKATDKQTDVADANIKELKHCLTRNVKLKLYGYNCCN
jgi:membrane fusion protein (multidrug efflux system)